MERPCQVQLHPVNTKFHMETFQSVFGQYSPAVIFICKIKIITMHVNAYPDDNNNNDRLTAFDPGQPG